MKGVDDHIIHKIDRIRHKIIKPKTFNISIKKIDRNSDFVLFYIHGWGGSSAQFFLTAKLLNIDVIMINYPREALSGDTKKTKRYFDEIKDIIKDQKYKKKYLFGTSLGGFMSLYIVSKIKINRLIISVAGSSLADTVWESIATKGIKKRLLKKDYDLERLRHEWKSIDPRNLKIKDKKILFFKSRSDKLVPYHLQKELAAALKKDNDVKIKRNIFGHYVTAAMNVVDIVSIRNFIYK